MLQLSEVKLFLRIDVADEDGYLNVLILLASEMVLNYLRLEELPSEQPAPLKQAMLIIIGYFFENREGTKEGMPDVVYMLLNPYRKAAF